MFSKIKKIFLVVTSFAFVVLLLSSIFFGTIKTAFFIEIARGLIDRKTDQVFGPDKKTAIIDGKKFKIPEEHLVIATKAKGIYKNNVIFRLEYIWPDLTPKRLAEPHEYETAKREGKNAYLWVEKAWPEKIEESLSLKPNKGGIIKNEFVGKQFGFDKYKYFSKDRKTGELKSLSASYILRDENQKITEALHCYGPYPPNNISSCNYHFIDKGLLYKVRFKDVASAENWASWKEKNISFIDQYRVE